VTVNVALIAGHRYGRRLAEAVIEFARSGDIKFSHAFLLHPRNMLRYGGYESAISTLQASDIPITMFDNVAELGSIGAIAEPEPQFVLVCGLRQLVPVPLLWHLARENSEIKVSSPRSGFICFHPSDLPDGAGQAPVQWTIFERRETGTVSAFFIDDKQIDGGPLIGKRRFQITPDADAGDLDRIIGDVIFDLFKEIAPKLANRNVDSEPQSAGDERRVRPQLLQKDRWIDFTWEMERIDRTVRAFAKPYGGATALIDRRPALIFKVKVEPFLLADARPGETSWDGNDIIVRCKNGAVRVLSTEFLDEDGPNSDPYGPRSMRNTLVV
jgi:methionyl-tRNA formyltransferase